MGGVPNVISLNFEGIPFGCSNKVHPVKPIIVIISKASAMKICRSEQQKIRCRHALSHQKINHKIIKV